MPASSQRIDEDAWAAGRVAARAEFDSKNIVTFFYDAGGAIREAPIYRDPPALGADNETKYSILSMPPENVLCERRGETTLVTLNRHEKLNALDAASVDILLRIVEAAAHDGTRLLVLRGNGRSFCAGFDFSGFEQMSEGDLLLRFVRVEQLLQAVHHAPYQTLALAHGRNFGAGVDLICACARRIAAPGTSFRMPGLQFGLVLGTRRLALRIGADRAREVLLESRTFDADEAVRMGFLTGLADKANWGDAIATAERTAALLDPAAREALYRLTLPDTRAEDLSDLVQSAARPGLIQRMRHYRNQLK